MIGRTEQASRELARIDRRLKRLYGEDYFKTYFADERRRASYALERDRIVRVAPQGGKIFDVGCGVGLFLEMFDSAKWEKYGVDIADFAIAEARSRGIVVKDYESGYDYPDETFDVIVFRGTIQHLDTPFAVIKKCVALLKKGGLMAFLSTPNANSLCYKLFGTLPALRAEVNFLIPSDVMLKNALTNFGLEVVQIRYPYLETPYARPLRDHLFFLLRCLGVRVTFPFWRNIMEIYAVKPRGETEAALDRIRRGTAS